MPTKLRRILKEDIYFYTNSIVIGDRAFATQDNELTIRIASHTGRVIMTDDEQEVLHKLISRMEFIIHH